MTASKATNSSFKLFLLDDDPIFRLGLFTALEAEEFADIQVIAHAETAALVELLAQEIPDLLLLAIDLVRYPERISSTVLLAQQLHNRYPNLVIFLLTPLGATEAIKKIPGVKGCCPKGIKVEELVEGLRVCVKGGNYFQGITAPGRVQKTTGGWLYRQAKLGIEQVESNLKIISNYINNNRLSIWDRWFWAGRKRELIAARWLIYQLLPSNAEVQEIEKPLISPAQDNLPIAVYPSSQSPSPAQTAFDLTVAKIKSSVNNCIGVILEIDILKEPRKKELLLIIIDLIKRNLEESTIIKIPPSELAERKEIILRDLWQTSTLNFLSRYYSEQAEDTNQYSLVDLILKEAPFIEEEILARIPFVTDLLAYWLFEREIKIDKVSYPYNSPSGQEIEEILLQNLLLNLANATMQFILNNFSDRSVIRYHLYEQEWKSSRKIAMFRNNLTWRYRREKYWGIPKNIFEDEYKVLKFDYQGITRGTISHPRIQELEQLKGLPWAVTMMIEFRDGIAKGVKAVGDIIGKTLVYILTEVLGRGIGLIGRGILQGIGNRIKN
jgi:CheY-like chemotaxis protein